jgi:1-acyl-sn-glycerol-3-phosphate acyltransferase
MRYRLLNTPFITPFIRTLCRITLKVFGWTIEGEIPAHVKKFVATVAPHTSNWDFVILLMTAFVLRVDAHWMGKHTLFRFPFRGIMTYFGGIPVDRSVRSGMVAKATAMFDAHDEFAIGIAPEGTRKAPARWRTGFWRVAHNVGVPVYLAFIDYSNEACRHLWKVPSLRQCRF